jgi:EmrB/QacA subfamily drug resistance transporter
MPEKSLDRLHHNATLAILALAGLAFSLQQTMIVPALPTLQRDLHTTTAWATWLLTGFLLVAAVATPIIGKLGDQYGKERLLVISLAVFFVGCVAATFAWDIGSLIACRCLQGFGGAVFPLAFAIINDEFPREKVGTGVGMISAILGIGGGLGLVLSGVLIDHLSWRWLFIVGAAAVGAAAVLVHRYVPESPVKTASRVDFVGASLLTGTLVSLLLALTEGESWGWGSPRITGLFVAAIAFGVAWVTAELRVPDPMIDMRMLVTRTVLFTNLTALLAGFAMFGSFVLVPNLIELPRGLPASLAGLVDYGFGASPTRTGLYLLPGALLGFLSGPAAGVLGRRYGSRVPLSLGMAIAAVGIALLARFHDEPWQVMVGMGTLGVGVPFSFAAMAKLIVDAVRPTETGVATGMNTVMRTIGGVVGGQIGAAILQTDTIGGTSVPAESAFVTAFWISAFVAAGAAVLGLFARGRVRSVATAVEPAEAAD